MTLIKMLTYHMVSLLDVIPLLVLLVMLSRFHKHVV